LANYKEYKGGFNMNFGLDLIKTYNEITPFPRKPTLFMILEELVL